MAPISKKKDRKEKIFEAALKCFNETGYYKTSIDKIAEKANISKGGIKLEAQENFSEGSILQLLIFTNDINLSIEGKVVYCNGNINGPYSLGISFTENRITKVQELEKIVSSISQREKNEDTIFL